MSASGQTSRAFPVAYPGWDHHHPLPAGHGRAWGLHPQLQPPGLALPGSFSPFLPARLPWPRPLPPLPAAWPGRRARREEEARRRMPALGGRGMIDGWGWVAMGGDGEEEEEKKEKKSV